MLPASFHQLSFRYKSRHLARVCEHIRQLPGGASLTNPDLLRLRFAWGNPGYTATLSYLRNVAINAHLCDGAILECGSGLTTVLAATITRDQSKPYVVLENDLGWFNYMQQVIDTLHLDHVKIVHAPLTRYSDGYEWYKLSDDIPQGIGLVICDGPPGRTIGGRYGLLPQMNTRLLPDCTILLDDTHRTDEQEIMDSWSELRSFNRRDFGYIRLSQYTIRAQGLRI